MKACAFVAFWGAFISLLAVAESLAQQTSTPKLEVIRGTGSAIILPRQAGSKDATDVSPLRSNTFELQSGRSENWISEPQSQGAASPRRERR